MDQVEVLPGPAKKERSWPPPPRQIVGLAQPGCIPSQMCLMAIENTSILFTDVVASTELSRRLSPDDAEEVRRVHLSILRQTIAQAKARKSRTSVTVSWWCRRRPILSAPLDFDRSLASDSSRPPAQAESGARSLPGAQPRRSPRRGESRRWRSGRAPTRACRP
jgi:hypothetical protein